MNNPSDKRLFPAKIDYYLCGSGGSLDPIYKSRQGGIIISNVNL